jgi:hypothetical protein
MLEWLAKEWYLKLFDTLLGLCAIGSLGVIVISIIRAIKKIGKPVLIKDGDKLSFELQDNESLEKIEAPVETKEGFTKLLLLKEEEIKTLKFNLQEVMERVKFLEAESSKRAVLDEYRENSMIPLTEHSVFFNIQKYVEGNTCFELDVSNPIIKTKVEVATAFIQQCKLPIFYSRLRDWVAEFNLVTSGKEGLTKLYSLASNLYKWVEEYSIKANDLKIELSDGRIFFGVPPSFINKFNELEEPLLKMILHKVHDVIYNNFYSSWQLKLIVILDHLDTWVYLMVKDAERTIETLNGHLERDIKAKLGQ